MIARPVMNATHIFDLIQEPGYEHTVQNLGELLKHFTSAFVSWWQRSSSVRLVQSGLISTACSLAMPGAVLRTLPLEEAFSCAFLHFKDNHFNILLLAAVVQPSAKLLPWTSFWQSLVCRSFWLLSSERRQVAEGACCCSWLATLG